MKHLFLKYCTNVLQFEQIHQKRLALGVLHGTVTRPFCEQKFVHRLNCILTKIKLSASNIRSKYTFMLILK